MGKAIRIVLPMLLAGMAGCFTEVGNPEDESQMTARFQIDYSPQAAAKTGVATVVDSVFVQQFSLRVTKAVCHPTDSTRIPEIDLWSDTAGTPVDFTGTLSSPLPTANLNADSITDMEMKFKIPARKKVTADSLNFTTFNDSGYVKGVYKTAGKRIEFLFALPDTIGALNLKYASASLNKWRTGSVYHCQFTFVALQWLAGVDLTGTQLVMDKSGMDLAIFDAEHNTVFYKNLTAASVRSTPSKPIEKQTLKQGDRKNEKPSQRQRIEIRSSCNIFVHCLIFNFTGRNTCDKLRFHLQPGHGEYHHGRHGEHHPDQQHPQCRGSQQGDLRRERNHGFVGGFSAPFGASAYKVFALTAGTHYYVCTNHASSGMKGQIVVSAVSATQPVSKNLNAFNFQIAGSQPITFKMSGDAARISVADIMGRTVWSAVVRKNDARNLTWDRKLADDRNAAPGTYFVQWIGLDAANKPSGKMSRTVVQLR